MKHQYAPFDEKSVATVEKLDTQKKFDVMFRYLRLNGNGNIYVTMPLRKSKHAWNNAKCSSAILSSIIWIKLCPKKIRVV